jgi:hypothetical protein
MSADLGRLFGYDQGVMGGLLTLPTFTKVFPEIDTTEVGLRGLSQSQANHRSTIQGISIGSYNVVSTQLALQLVPPKIAFE